MLNFLEDNTDTSSNDDEIEMNSTLENPILKSEPKNESDVVVKEEKSINKSKSKNGMYGVVIFLMNSMVFCQSSRLYLTGFENLTPRKLRTLHLMFV
jgi:hypothetical protein